MQLFDTLRGAKAPLHSGGVVKLYVCGVTPYDTTHVGHARTYLVFDVLVRRLRHAGQQVRYIQNITDVDDSILRRAADLNEPFEELGRRYTDIYMRDTRDLNMVPADLYPAATETILAMQDMIARLLEQGHAYRLDNGDVYFRVSSFEAFGRLSRLSRSEMCAIERTQDGTTIDDARKEDPLDFVLWRAARPGEPRWPSPWGEGRPGWHIECSAMVRTHLGDQIDIHGGGDDLVYPHHECEIAQSEAATGARPFVRFWVHVALVRLGGEKMSKSLGNVVFVRELIERVGPNALRLYLLGTHYRTPLDYDEGDLEEAAGRAGRLARAARAHLPQGDSHGDPLWGARFLTALDDDLDTPFALAILQELADSLLVDPEQAGSRAAQRTLMAMADLLGLRL